MLPPPDHNNLLGVREVRFHNRQEAVYPSLMRFCLDFNFKVLQLLLSAPNGNTAPVKVIVMAQAEYNSDPTAAITPAFTRLDQLERYVADNQVDILHDYLFGLDELSQRDNRAG